MSKSLLHSKRAKAYALLLLNTILWGFAPPIIKYSLEFVTVNHFLLGRYLLASLIFLPIYLLKKHKSQISNFKSQILLVFLALLGTPLTLIPLYEGIKLTSSIEASILTASGPILVILGGHLFLKEKIAKNEKIGIVLALLGTIILTFEPSSIVPARPAGGNFQLSILHSSALLGNLLILVSNLIWTAFLLIVKKLKTDASQISLFSYLVSIPVFATLVLIESPQTFNSPLSIFNSSAFLGIFYMALFGSVIAFWAYARGQEDIEASEASVFTYLQPIFTFPLAYFWLHESITNTTIIASLIIAFGVYLSEHRA